MAVVVVGVVALRGLLVFRVVAGSVGPLGKLVGARDVVLGVDSAFDACFLVETDEGNAVRRTWSPHVAHGGDRRRAAPDRRQVAGHAGRQSHAGSVSMMSGEAMNRNSSDSPGTTTHGHGRVRTRWARMAILAVVLGWAMAQPRVARAQEDQRGIDAAIWGLSTLELTTGVSLGAMIMWDPRATESSRYGLYVLPPLITSFGMAALSHEQRWETTVPSAMHGALWGGIDGLIVGMLIDGRSHERGLTLGPWAYGLAAVGSLAGGWLGATAIEPGDSTGLWMAGPPVGAAFAVVFATVPAIIIDMNYSDRLARRFFWWSMATCVAGGLLFGALPPQDEQAEGASIRRADQHRVMMLSLPPWQF